ncbi:MAG: endonuclease [Candidatus Eisenbacteria bacterium]|nr:endonuclease [Candidatus Eisenbacteria bacterium]
MRLVAGALLWGAAGLLVVLWTGAPRSAPADGGSRDAAPPLRVMSFNIRYGSAADGENAWPQRREMVVETILRFDPDLLGLQECLAEQADDLQAALSGYAFFGAGRDDGQRAGEMCAILYRRARFEELAGGHFWLSETPSRPGSRGWDAACPRMVSWVRLAERGRAAGGALCFLNTHFDHRGSRARREAALLLRERLGDLCGSCAVIVTGDFNAPADAGESAPYRILLGEVGSRAERAPRDARAPRVLRPLIDTYRALHPLAPGEGTYHGFRGERFGARIDWILATPDLHPLEAAIVSRGQAGRYPSDHFPVTAVLHRVR